MGSHHWALGRGTDTAVRMFSHLLLLMLFLQGWSLTCYQCQGGNEAGGCAIPGGTSTINCRNSCAVRSVSNAVTKKWCETSDNKSGFTEQNPGSRKWCKESRGGQEKTCYCKSDHCNGDVLPANSSPVTTTSLVMVSLTLMVASMV